jgi:hypothetical protein
VAREIPRAIGRYAVLDRLGAGGFATVYGAHDPVLDRDVALKVLHPHLAEEPDTRGRFLHEGRALARIQHPNIVKVFDAGEADGLVYLAMELVEGRSLAATIREDGPLSLPEVARIAEGIAAALVAVHERGLVHCDVKPANVLVERDGGRVVLLDLGVARRVDDTMGTTSWMLGTPSFMAPEQISSGRPVSAQTDVYQLAGTVHALLAGEPPYTGDPAQVMYAIVHEPPADLSRLDRGISPAVARLVRDGMAKQPGDRPAGPQSFAGRLRDLVTPQTSETALPKRARVASGPAFGAGALAGAEHRSRPDAGAPFARGHQAGVDAEGPTRRIGWAEHAAPRMTDVARPERGRSRGPVVLGGIAVLVAAATLAGILLTGNGSDNGATGAATELPQARVVAERTAVRFATPEATPAPQATPAPSPQPLQSTTVPATPRPPAQGAGQVAVPPRSPVAQREATAVPSEPAAVEGIRELILGIMSRQGYAPSGPVVPVPANGNATLYIQRGEGADGQRLFVFLNDRYVGTDWEDASPMGISDPQATGRGEFVAHYTDSEGRLMPVTFRWQGNRLRPDGIAPGHCQPTTGC